LGVVLEIAPVKKNAKIRIFSGEDKRLAIYCDDPGCTDVNYNIYDLNGKKLSAGKIDFRKNDFIDISSLMTGVYIAGFKNKQLTEAIRFIK
jgi:hypothetical protein